MMMTTMLLLLLLLKQTCVAFQKNGALKLGNTQ